MLTIEILVTDSGWTRLLPDPQAWARPVLDRAAGLLPAGSLPEEAEVSVLLADDAAVRRLNRDYRNQDKATNVLSFPSQPVPGVPVSETGALLGDIAMARETVLAEAEAGDLPFDHHATHLLVHGFLHLLGFDHQTDAEAAVMEGLETGILKTLDIPDPYGDDRALQV
jgi:probable rRNA maturation factor